MTNAKRERMFKRCAESMISAARTVSEQEGIPFKVALRDLIVVLLRDVNKHPAPSPRPAPSDGAPADGRKGTT